MKQFIIALFLLSFSLGVIASPVPYPVIKEIPLGVEIRKDILVMYTLCGEPLAISVHTPDGTQVYRGDDMYQKLEEMDEYHNGTGIPAMSTDLGAALDGKVLCIDPGYSDMEPEKQLEQKRLPIEEMIDGSRPMWSASYQP